MAHATFMKPKRYPLYTRYSRPYPYVDASSRVICTTDRVKGWWASEADESSMRLENGGKCGDFGCVLDSSLGSAR